MGKKIFGLLPNISTVILFIFSHNLCDRIRGELMMTALFRYCYSAAAAAAVMTSYYHIKAYTVFFFYNKWFFDFE